MNSANLTKVIVAVVSSVSIASIGGLVSMNSTQAVHETKIETHEQAISEMKADLKEIKRDQKEANSKLDRLLGRE